MARGFAQPDSSPDYAGTRMKTLSRTNMDRRTSGTQSQFQTPRGKRPTCKNNTTINALKRWFRGFYSWPWHRKRWLLLKTLKLRTSVHQKVPWSKGKEASWCWPLAVSLHCVEGGGRKNPPHIHLSPGSLPDLECEWGDRETKKKGKDKPQSGEWHLWHI